MRATTDPLSFTAYSLAPITRLQTFNCKVYNPVFVALKQATGVLNKSYDSVGCKLYSCRYFSSHCRSSKPFHSSHNGWSLPDNRVSIKFTNANPFDAMVSLTKALGLYYWGDGNALTINIGTRDNTVQTPTIYEQGTKRGVDRSKQIGQVVIKGTDINGVQIQGSAGTSGAIKYFTDSKSGRRRNPKQSCSLQINVC